MKWIADMDVVWDMDMLQSSVLDDCFLGIEWTVTNTNMQSRTRVKYGHGAVVHTDLTVINVPSIKVPRYVQC